MTEEDPIFGGKAMADKRPVSATKDPAPAVEPSATEERKGPKHLRRVDRSGRAIVKRVFPPVELTQEEWDIIHGPDPLAIYTHRRSKRPVPNLVHVDPQNGELFEASEHKTPLGWRGTTYRREVECPSCGCFVLMIRAEKLHCLGCRKWILTIADEVERLRLVEMTKKVQATVPEKSKKGGAS